MIMYASDNEIVEAYKSGMSVTEIFRKYRTSSGRLYRTLIRKGVERRQPQISRGAPRPLSPRVFAAAEAYKNGERALHIEARTGITNQTIYRAIRKLGIPVRRIPPTTKKQAWCLWCGENLKSSRKKFCTAECKRSYVADVRGIETLGECKSCHKPLTIDRANYCKPCESSMRLPRYKKPPSPQKACSTCGNPIPPKRLRFCSIECCKASRELKFSEEELESIKHRIMEVESFSTVAKELGIKRWSLIGYLYRSGFTIEGERKRREAHC